MIDPRPQWGPGRGSPDSAWTGEESYPLTDHEPGALGTSTAKFSWLPRFVALPSGSVIPW